MEASELRIGSNYKLRKTTSIDENIITLSFQDIKVNGGNICNLIEPIPLTEEWLLKLGFDRGSDIMGECYFINEKIEFVIYIEDEWLCYYTGSLMLEIETVHQLQNLYFALTGEELTI
jgi:hypothetical protein